MASITINGRPHETGPVEVFHFHDVVDVVRGRGAEPSRYEVTFYTRRQGPEQLAGSLLPGRSVQLEDGMVFEAQPCETA